jgi:hypothetical protein
MTMREAAAWLGWSGKRPIERLRRALLAIERKIGKEIMVRVGGESFGARYLVSAGALRQHAPGLWLGENKLREKISSELGKLRKEVADMKEQLSLLEQGQGACFVRLRRIESTREHARAAASTP